MISFEFDTYREPQMMVTKEREEKNPLVMKKNLKIKKYIRRRKK